MAEPGRHGRAPAPAAAHADRGVGPEDRPAAAADGAPAGLPFAVEEHRLELVRLDLFEGSPHLLVLGDAECGKSSLLRLIARQLAARYPPEEVALLVVDLRRGLLDLTALPNLAGYACTPATVAQAVEHLHRELTDRSAGRPRPLPTRPGAGSGGPASGRRRGTGPGTRRAGRVPPAGR